MERASAVVTRAGRRGRRSSRCFATCPTGAITFRLFGPDDAVCAGPPVFTSTTAVDGNGQYTSDAFTPTAPGAYRWVAAYGGDAGNAAVTTACGEADEITEVAEVAGSVVSSRRP